MLMRVTPGQRGAPALAVLAMVGICPGYGAAQPPELPKDEDESFVGMAGDSARRRRAALLAAELNDPDRAVRERAALALACEGVYIGSRNIPRLVVVLVDAMRRADAAERQAALRGLQRAGWGMVWTSDCLPAVELSLACLADQDAGVRREAARLLGDIAESRSCHTITPSCLGDVSERQRPAFRACVKPLIQALAEPEHLAQTCAATALAHVASVVGDSEALAVAIQCLVEPGRRSETVLEHPFWTLVTLRHHRACDRKALVPAIPMLLSVVKRGDGMTETSASLAGSVLGQIATAVETDLAERMIFGPIGEFLVSDDLSVRYRALLAFRGMGRRALKSSIPYDVVQAARIATRGQQEAINKRVADKLYELTDGAIDWGVTAPPR